MARPKKTGLDYFPKDTNIYSDRKIRRLRSEFGAKGLLIYDYLLCVIYQDKGYYVRYDDQLNFDVSDVVGCGISEELVKEVVNGCVRVGLFDKDLYNNVHILTSSGIQKRYCSAKRNPVIADEITIIDTETIVNTAKTSINSVESTQSKVKESKVNRILSYSLKNASGEIRSIETPKNFLKMWNAYIKHYDKSPSNRNILSTNNKSNLQELKKHFGIDCFVTAMNGLFKNSTYKHCRTDPTHFLNPENFQNYLNSGQTGKKLFENKRPETEKL